MRKINWRYAIGELIIITIGITLAFNLNRWAERQSDEKKARSYIENLKAELEQDRNQLDSNIRELESRLKFMNEFLPHLRKDLPGRARMAARIYSVIDPVTFRSNGTTWQSLKFSGDIHLIESLELRNQIIRHYETYEAVEEEKQRHTNFSKDHLARFFMKEVDYANMARENFPHLNSNYFMNLMYALRGIYQKELEAHLKARESVLDLLEALAET